MRLARTPAFVALLAPALLAAPAAAQVAGTLPDVQPPAAQQARARTVPPAPARPSGEGEGP